MKENCYRTCGYCNSTDIVDGPIGDGDGEQGTYWSDGSLHTNGYITGMELVEHFAWSCCWLVTAIRTKYGDVWSDWHGLIAADTPPTQRFELKGHYGKNRI